MVEVIFYSLLSYPTGIAIDADGNVYVADAGNNRIRKITSAGVVSTLAGTGTAGSANGTGTTASFSSPSGVDVDGSGNVYVVDQLNELIRKITPMGFVSTLAGSTVGFADGTATTAKFFNLTDVAVDAWGNVYVTDGNLIRKITPAGVVSTLAGYTQGLTDGNGNGTLGFADGTGTAAKFAIPSGIAVDASGNVYVADLGNYRIRKITPAGVVSTLAGTGTRGSTNGAGTMATFNQPTGITVDAYRNLYVADKSNHLIRKITPPDGPSCGTYTQRTTTHGLGSNFVNSFFAVGSTVYAATTGGLSISTDGGVTFTNRTQMNAMLGDDYVYDIYAVGSTVYAATRSGGLSISTDGGATFTNRTQMNAMLGDDDVKGVYVVGSTVYAATLGGGLSISTNGGTSFTNRTKTANGLGSNRVQDVYVVGSTVYAATDGGLSISTDGGTSFTNRTKMNNMLGDDLVTGVYAVGSTVYAATAGGLSISTDGGATFTNKTTADGLGDNSLFGVYAIGSTVYAATDEGLSISTNGGASFTNYLSSRIIENVYADESKVYAAVRAGGLSFCPPLEPTITTTGALTAFSACSGTASAEQSFTVEGSALTAAISITAPTGFQVSTTSGSSFGSSASISQSGGTASGTVYVRMSALAASPTADNVNLTSTGATAKTVAVSGTVNALPTLTIGTIPAICAGATSFTIPFTMTTGTPTSYTVSGTGITTATASLGIGPITVNLSAAATTSPRPAYSLTVKNAAGCVSSPAYTGNVTVNALPDVLISGPTAICVGGTTNLTLITPSTGGTWASSDNTIATVTNAGVVTGVSAGSATFTFTNSSTGCVSKPTSALTVNALPVVSITGANPICVNATTTLSPNTGGSWLPNKISVATVTDAGIVTGVSGGTATFTFRETSTGCFSAATSAVTVNALPTIGGPSTVLVGSTITLTGSGTAATTTPYLSSITAAATVDNAGVVTGLANGNTTITYTDANGCQQTKAITVTTCTPPSVFSVTGGGAYCAGGDGIEVGLGDNGSGFMGDAGGSEIGVTYQLQRDGVNVSGSSPVAGTGLPISFGKQTVAGTYTVVATRTSGGCTENMAGSKTVTINPLPTITLGTLPIVAAGATSFTIPYTGFSGSPTRYSISGTGFSPTTNGLSNPITVILSAPASLNIDFSLTVSNANGCTSAKTTGTVLVTTPVAAGTTTVNFRGTDPIAPTATAAGVGGRGSIATYTVPAGVTALKIDAKGAKGGKTPDFNGGAGGRVQATYAVTPGDVLYIMVGGKGGDGASDGDVIIDPISGATRHRSAAGGGGGTFVFKGSISAANLLVAAGGGGGAGDQGNGGISNSSPGTGAGSIAAGGGSLSTDGGTSNVGDDCGKGGKAAINTGNGGENACFKPETNGGGYGGGGAGNYSISNNAAGGGGGGGYVGGNSGGVAGGNGGSSFTASGATNVTTNNHSDDNGCVVFCVAATVAYTGSPYCKSLTTSGTPTTTGYTGGTFSATPAGLTIDATTGVISPNTSTAGIYTVTYNTPNLVGCVAATASVTIQATTPSVSINPTAVCAGSSATFTATGTNGGSSPQFSWTKNNVSVGIGNTLVVSNAVAGDVYKVTLVPSAEVCPSPATAMASVTVKDCSTPSISCPPTIRIEFNQLTANGLAMPEVTGFLKTFIQADNVSFTDQKYNVNCGAIQGGNLGFNQALLADAIQVLTRTFVAKNTGSIISYSCSQQIYVGAPKLTDVVFPIDKILPCADSRIEPTDTSINHYTVLGTGYPTISNQVLGQGLVTNLTQTYTDERITTANGFTIKRTWLVKNVCTGETRIFVQNLTFNSTAGTCPTALSSISGNIRREDLMDIPAQISVYNTANDMLNSATNPSYSFNNLLINKGYRITAERPNTDWTNGVTTFDVALISRHILGIAPLTTPYQMIAADANRNGEVEASDLLHFQRLILRLDSQLPNNNSWRFVPKNYVFGDPANPFASDFPEVLNVSNLTSAVTNGDFVAIKVGDVNNSLGTTSIRGDAKPFLLNTEDMILEKGKTYHIPIQLTPSVNSFQFTLNVDKNAAKIESIETGNLPNFTDNNTGLFQKQGIITAAWYRKEGQLLSETDKLTMMTVVLKPTVNTRLSEIMSINSAVIASDEATEGVAYDAEGTGLPVQLTFGNQKSSNDKAVLLPNRPNPFSNETTISFILPEATVAKITVCDLLGKVVMVSEKQFAKGLNEVVFDAKNTPSVASGIFVVRLQTVTGVAEQKIVSQR